MTSPDDAVTSASVSDVMNATLEVAHDKESTWEESFAEFLFNCNRILLPVIIVLGLIGNGLSFFVLVRSGLDKLSSSVYLAALCVTDSLFLLQLTATWLSYLRVDIFHQPVICQLIIYTHYVSAFLSVWIVVAFTFERYIVCAYPLKRHLVSNRRAKFAVVILTVVAGLLYNHCIWAVEVRHGVCTPVKKYEDLNVLMSHVDTVVTLFLPSVLIVTMNIKIVHLLAKAARFRWAHATPEVNTTRTCQAIPLQQTSMTSSGSGGKTDVVPTRQAASSRRTTRMLVAISTIFLLLNAPNHLVRFYELLTGYLDGEDSTNMSQTFYNIRQVALFVYYLNFSINFLLYCLCGHNFRREMRSILKDGVTGTTSVNYLGNTPSYSQRA